MRVQTWKVRPGEFLSPPGGRRTNQPQNWLANFTHSLPRQARTILIYGKDEVGRKKSFGKALSSVQDRVFSITTDDGLLRLQIAADGIRHKTKLWKLAL